MVCTGVWPARPLGDSPVPPLAAASTGHIAVWTRFHFSWGGACQWGPSHVQLVKAAPSFSTVAAPVDTPTGTRF